MIRRLRSALGQRNDDGCDRSRSAAVALALETARRVFIEVVGEDLMAFDVGKMGVEVIRPR